ncbi:MAG: PH domain-containing protein [Patescibacteria group bacterium]|jgi:hypothetical protein
MDPFKYFPDKRPNEEIVLLLRRHWHEIIGYFLVLILEIVLPIIIFIVFLRFTEFVWDKDSPISVLIFFSASSYYLFIWLFFFHHWIDYYLDVWVVTDQRIINIEQKALFSRTVSELNMSTIQDVTSEVKGKLATILKFGDVHIQTAAEEKRFVFEKIPNPQEVATKITELHRLAEHKNGLNNPTSQLQNDQSEAKDNVSQTF